MFRIFEIITEIVGWILITLSPTLLGIALGLGIYLYFPNSTGMTLGILVALTGLITGMVWATKKYRTTGTIHFLSRISATPELDNLNSDEEEKTNIRKN